MNIYYMYYLFFFISFILFLLGVLLCIAYITLLERKLIASVHRRKGPNNAFVFGVFQPIADALKLLNKFFIIPQKTTIFLFFIAPHIGFYSSLFLWVLFPFSYFSFLPELSELSLLIFISMSSLTIHSFIFLQGSHNRFSLLGSKRAISQMIAYDLCLSIIYITFFCLHNSLSLYDIITDQIDTPNIYLLFPLWILFIIVSAAELNRIPYDLLEEESVLVGGFMTEYGGFFFALLFLGEYGMMCVFSYICTIFFFGTYVHSFLLAFFILGHVSIYIIFRFVFPRNRYDQLLKIGWKFILPISGFYSIFILLLNYILLLLT